MIEPTNKFRVSLRRFVWSDKEKCPLPHGYHDAEIVIGDAADYEKAPSCGDKHDHSDERWPKACACGYQFKDEDQWQWNAHALFERKETGERWTLNSKLPIGAMYNADWMPQPWQGLDGLSLVVMTPGGLWNIDSRANNCTLPNDTVHKCWCRQGVPPNIDVNKNGHTCAAGGGSIICGNYHGFLRHGHLEDA